MSMKWFREPLLHFMAGGALLFGVVHWIDQSRNTAGNGREDTVHIGSGEVAWMQEAWTKQWQRPATRDELIGAVTTFLKEELLAREARAMGLEKDDTLVRRRLAQKLSFLLEDTFRLAEPPEVELRAYFEANAARYETAARASFGHIFFDPEKRTNADADARTALAQLSSNEIQPAAETLGDRLLIESPIVDADHAAIAAQFGDEFAAAVLAQPEKVWQGPVRSAYGLHLVRVDHRSATKPAEFANALPRLREDWYREQQGHEIERYFARLMEKYRVETDPEVRGMIGPLDELLPQAIGGAGEAP